MVQERDKKKFLCLFALSAVKIKTTENAKDTEKDYYQMNLMNRTKRDKQQITLMARMISVIRVVRC